VTSELTVFHETKNFICGEGGAIVLNRPICLERAEIVREKGTDRSRFFRGQVDKYTWVDIGSSLLPSDILAAFLYAQLENMELITKKTAGNLPFLRGATPSVGAAGPFQASGHSTRV
jgi:dTDP-4-amino-4,6-dideoxygalactose transaminase